MKIKIAICDDEEIIRKQLNITEWQGHSIR